MSTNSLLAISGLSDRRHFCVIVVVVCSPRVQPNKSSIKFTKYRSEKQIEKRKFASRTKFIVVSALRCANVPFGCRRCRRYIVRARRAQCIWCVPCSRQWFAGAPVLQLILFIVRNMRLGISRTSVCIRICITCKFNAQAFAGSPGRKTNNSNALTNARLHFIYCFSPFKLCALESTWFPCNTCLAYSHVALAVGATSNTTIDHISTNKIVDGNEHFEASHTCIRTVRNKCILHVDFAHNTESNS